MRLSGQHDKKSLWGSHRDIASMYVDEVFIYFLFLGHISIPCHIFGTCVLNACLAVMEPTILTFIVLNGTFHLLLCLIP